MQGNLILQKDFFIIIFFSKNDALKEYHKYQFFKLYPHEEKSKSSLNELLSSEKNAEFWVKAIPNQTWMSLSVTVICLWDVTHTPVIGALLSMNIQTRMRKERSKNLSVFGFLLTGFNSFVWFLTENLPWHPCGCEIFAKIASKTTILSKSEFEDLYKENKLSLSILTFWKITSRLNQYR